MVPTRSYHLPAEKTTYATSKPFYALSNNFYRMMFRTINPQLSLLECFLQ